MFNFVGTKWSGHFHLHNINIRLRPLQKQSVLVTVNVKRCIFWSIVLQYNKYAYLRFPFLLTVHHKVQISLDYNIFYFVLN